MAKRVLVILLLTTACNQPFLHPRPPAPEPPFPEPATADAVQELSLERGPCMDMSACPSYRYTYHRDGRATFDSLSIKSGKQVRRSTAALDSVTFDALARAFLHNGFFRMQPRYSTGVTDQTELIVRAALADTVKTVSEDEGKGPAELHELEQLLDSTGNRLAWHVISDSS
jgi:Domain of unknown function (DUF6438)